ncbi:ABC transporter ATP-binding protein [uncultured Maritalea sp.]|uniref:ABC transporter ATP-binding protein n=1 Tax=uncultured Maritalea sp. TaxID=757249 RepID=UPI00261308AF|nr:ABC transporter ATP-binding protein [uncultured Maritalea sp.]
MSALLELKNIRKGFGAGPSEVIAVDDVSLCVQEGECLAIVGESGSGKTTLANMILGIYAQSSGQIEFDGQSLPAKRELSHRRAIQLVQQNPLSSLNPKRSVGASVRLGLDVYGIGEKRKRWELVEQALEDVALPAEFRTRSPSSLSGGQRQRVAIARALACQSRLVVLDEPTSALDVLVQSRVLRLLNDLRRAKGLTYFFITHDLSVVRNVADRVAVFKAGQLVECAKTEDVFESPQQEYTRQLIAAVPVVADEELALRTKLTQEISS